MRLRAAAAASFVAMLCLAVPATAQDSKPPKTRLTSGSTNQQGLQRSYCWDTTCADYIAGYPDPKPAKTEARARVRFFLAEEPGHISVSWNREVDENNFPTDETKTIKVRVVPHEVDGEIVAYDARFRLPRRPGHAYISVAGDWPDHGDSYWTFHLRLRK